MKKFAWYVKRVWQLRYQHTLYKRWQDRYRAAKLALGLSNSHDCRQFNKISTLDKGNREAFLRALIIEVTEHNRDKAMSNPSIIRWRQVFKVMENLGVWGMQKNIYDLMKISDSKPVNSFDIKNFESHNPEDNMIM